MFFYDLDDDSLIKKFNVIEGSGIPMLKNDRGQVRVSDQITKKGNFINSLYVFQIGSLAFDDWKLVTVLYVKRFDYKRILFDTFVSIFDISNFQTIRRVNTIGTRFSCNRAWPVDILLPSNEKILINAKYVFLFRSRSDPAARSP